mmetsp:Transcript_6780/g.28597  ORF Transcript_6780/g.28597 Transcript_6780/m.28597 type:complete len:769 (-) Transcript_6780:45-2351(-)
MGNEASTARTPAQGKAAQSAPPALHMRVVLRGDRKTGKTCLYNLLQKKRFTEEYNPTRGPQKAVVDSDFQIGGIAVKLEVVDAAEDGKGKSEGLKLATGQQQKTAKRGFYEGGDEAPAAAGPEPTAAQRERAKTVYKGAHAAVFLLDPNKRWTFEWAQRELACLPGHVPALVIANFRDAAAGREAVPLQEVRQWCAGRGKGVRYCEASMLNRYGVKAIRAFLRWPFLLMEKQYLLARLKALDSLAEEASEQFEAVSREQDYAFYKEWLDRTLRERMEAQGKAAPSAKGKATASKAAPASAAAGGQKKTPPGHPPAQKAPESSGGFFSKIKSIVSGGDSNAAPPPAKKKKPTDPRKAIEEIKKIATDASRGKVAEVDIDNFDPTAVDGDNDYDDFFGSDDEDDEGPPRKLEESDEEVETNPWVQEDADIDEDDVILAENRKAAAAAKGFYSDDDDDEEDDDEYCHATHADDFYWAAFTRHANLYHVLRIEGLMLATDDVSAIALDGTVLRPDAITTIDATSPRLECDSRGEGVRARITRKAHFEVLASALGLPGGKPKGRPQETSLSDTSRRLRKLGLPSGSETDEQEVVKKLMAMPFYAVDTIRFMRLLAHVSRDEPRPSRHYCPADEDARVAVRDVQALPDGGADREMDRVLDYYRAARRRELANDEDLAKLMNSVNPAFVPREWMVREAALDLLEGSGEEFEKQLAWVADMFNCKVPAAYQSTRIPPLRLPCRAKERPLPFTDECATLSFNMVLEPQLLAARLRGA